MLQSSTLSPWNPKSTPRANKGHSFSHQSTRSSVSPPYPYPSWHLHQDTFHIPLYTSTLPYSYTLFASSGSPIPCKYRPSITRKLFKLHQHLQSYLFVYLFDNNPNPAQSFPLQQLNTLLCAWLSARHIPTHTRSPQPYNTISSRIETLRQHLKHSKLPPDERLSNLLSFLISQLHTSWTAGLYLILHSRNPPYANTSLPRTLSSTLQTTPTFHRPPASYFQPPSQTPFQPLTPSDFATHLTLTLQKHTQYPIQRLYDNCSSPPNTTTLQLLQLIQLSRIIAFQLISDPITLQLYSQYIPHTPLEHIIPLPETIPQPLPVADSFAIHWLATAFCPSLAFFLSRPVRLR